MRIGVALLVLASATIASADEPGDKERARDLIIEAEAYWQHEQWGQALVRFRKAVALEPSAAVYFNIGWGADKLGKCALALAGYQAFLRNLADETVTDPEKLERNKAYATERILELTSKCEPIREHEIGLRERPAIEPDKPDKPDKPDRPDRPDRPRAPDKPGEPDRPDEAGAAAKPEPPDDDASGLGTGFWVSAGLTVACIAGGTITGVYALDNEANRGQGILSTDAPYATASTVLFAGAVVSAGFAVGFLLVGSSGESHAAVSAGPTRSGGFAARASWRF